MAKYLIVGPCDVQGVAPGGVVELDPSEVNVDALLAAGHVKPAPTKRGPKLPAPMDEE